MPKYIVTSKLGVDQEAFKKMLTGHGVEIDVDFQGLKRVYEVEMPTDMKPVLRAEPDVYHVALADAEVLLNAEQNLVVDSNAKGDNWGLARIWRRDNWNDSSWYPFSGKYVYFKTGKGVDVYVVDSGIRKSHVDFEDRSEVIFDHYNNPGSSGYGVDTNGHGTHVSSTIAGKKYGVAKEAKILVSRVFQNSSATLTAIVNGIDAALTHHENKKAAGSKRPSVMNLSLGGPPNVTEEQVVNDCIDAGIVVCAASGNDGRDLAEPGFDVMPAEIQRAITVGASSIQDRMASFSNYGYMVDVFAPGQYICAASYLSNTGESVMSGTSMATPHVAGVCALYLQGKNTAGNATLVKEVHDWIWDNATKDTLHLSSEVEDTNTANKLLFSEFVTDEPDPTPDPTPDPEPDPTPDPTPDPEPDPKPKKPKYWDKIKAILCRYFGIYCK